MGSEMCIRDRTADGQTVKNIAPEERVTIRQSPNRVRLIDLQGLSFYELLRRMLDWNVASRTPKED